MDPLTASIAAAAAKVAEHVLGNVLDELSGPLRRAITGDVEKTKALEAAFQAGLEAAIATTDPPSKEHARYTGRAIEMLLEIPDAAAEVAKLIDVRAVGEDPDTVVNIDRLEVLFREHYRPANEPTGYAGLDIATAMRAFVRAYVPAVEERSDKLPFVNTGYLRAMLERMNLLPGMAEDISAIRKAVTGEEAHAQAIGAYLEWVCRRCGFLPLRGIDIGASDPTAQQKRLELAQVYIDLDTKAEQPAKEPHRAKIETQVAIDRQVRRVRALEAAGSNPQLVLLGDPGSGKSTFLNYLALCLAGQRLDPDADWLKRIPDWPADAAGVVPVLVTLRAFARWMSEEADRPTPHLLWNFIVDRLRAENLGAAVEPLCERLERGEALLLFDGLDEVPTAGRRSFVRDSVVAFLARYSSCRALVTCRTLSYEDPAWKLPNVSDYELASLDEQKIDRFIEAWYAELGRIEVVPPAEATQLAKRLQHAIRRQDLWRLAPNPLLLTVMALVHTHKGRLPEARAMLYEDTVDILLWRWEQRKADGSEETTPLRQLLLEAGRSDVDLKRVVWELAFSAHREIDPDDEEALADIGELELVKALAELHPDNDWGWAKAIVAQMKERAGLLLEREPGAFSFPHRTFQEYLAGAHLSAASNFAQQAAALAVEGAFWREVILLAVGRLVYLSGDVSRPLALVGELCPAEMEDQASAWRKAWLAGDALVETGLNRVRDSALGRDLAERVRYRLASLLDQGHLSPVERARVGRTLAHLGDPRPGVSVDASTGLPDIVWCEVPGGSFLMGSDKDKNPDAWGDELPQHEEPMPGPYYISRYPITVAQFDAFVEAGGYATEDYWGEAQRAGLWKDGWITRRVEVFEEGESRTIEEVAQAPHDYGEPFNLLNHPVVGITWYEALAFCRWLQSRLEAGGTALAVWRDEHTERLELQAGSFHARLPTEVEWEKAARGTDGGIYPWGDEPDPNKANYGDTGIRATSAVGCFPAGESPYYVLDMSGNVLEWCQTKWRESYETPADETLEGDAPRVLRVKSEISCKKGGVS